MKQMAMVAPGIFRIKQTVSRFKFSVNTYVIAGADGLVLDPGFGSRRAGHILERCIDRIADEYRRRGTPFQVTRAMASHSHWDHFAGLARLERHFGLEVLATDLQAAKITSPKGYDHSFWENEAFIDSGLARGTGFRMKNFVLNALCMGLFRVRFVRGPVTKIVDGQRLWVNGRTWEIIPVPGHSDDDIALFNRDSGILLSGDLVFRTVPTWLGPEKSDLGLYLDSLERIRNLAGLKRILPAHGSPIEDPDKALCRAMAYSHKRTARVQDIVASAGEQGIRFNEIYQGLHPGADRGRVSRIADAFGVKPALSGGWIAVRLKYLKEGGELEVFRWKGQLRFRARH